MTMDELTDIHYLTLIVIEQKFNAKIVCRFCFNDL